MKYLTITIIIFSMLACTLFKKEKDKVTIDNETPIKGTYSDKKVGDKQLFNFNSNSELGLPLEEFYRVDGKKVDNDNEYEHTFDKKGVTTIEGVAKTTEDSAKVTWMYDIDNTSVTAIDTSITMLEDGSKIIDKDDLLFDADNDETSLSITGTDNVNASVNGDGNMEITGLENYFGNATINYVGTDGESTGTGQIEINFTPVDDLPTASNVNITPLEAFVGDTIRHSYNYNDVEGDLEGNTIINQYVNNQVLNNNEELITNNLAANDRIKKGIIPVDENGVEGVETFSNEITLQAKPYRIISGQILEHWSQTPDEGVRIITSVGETFTDANGEYSVQASTDREDVLVLKEERLESGYILMPSQNDTTYNHTISNDTKEAGIDRWLFKNYVLKQKDENGYGRGDEPEDGQYVALTNESVPDTAWILGHVEGPLSWTTSFQNLNQINLLGKLINETANTATNGLYNINKTTILVADNNYANANFDYPNMKAVPNETFPANNEEQYKNYFIIAASEGDMVLNGTFYKNDNVTIEGHNIILGNWLNLQTLEGVFNTEFYASIMGRLETPDGYGSVFDDNGREVLPHDNHLTNFVIDRGPGSLYPDFPANFNPTLINQHNDN